MFSGNILASSLDEIQGLGMAPTELVADCYRDVTIYMVKKLSMDEQAGSSSKKRRRTDNMQALESDRVTTLGEVKAKASRLRQCSTYFEACMSERWAQPEAETFHLEVQTEVCYYEDCFSRMHSLFKRIPSVTYCIELLKVASQIGFQDVIDIGVKFLASAPWTHEEENLIRHFCGSHLVPFHSLTELIARAPEESKLNKSSSFTKNLLTRYLQNAIPGIIEGSSVVETGKECEYSRRKKFEGVFHLVVSGAEPEVCANVVEYALDLLTEASLGLLSHLREEFCADYSPGNEPVQTFRWIMSSFIWLFKTARKANAAQTVVELLLDNDYASDIIRIMYQWDIYATKWARMMYSIFQGVLKGDLFLTTSQRMKLFNKWRWILCADILTLDDASFITQFISTFPQQQQEDIWKGVDFGIEFEPSFKAYTTWVSYVLNAKARRHQELTASSEEDGSQD